MLWYAGQRYDLNHQGPVISWYLVFHHVKSTNVKLNNILERKQEVRLNPCTNYKRVQRTKLRPFKLFGLLCRNTFQANKIFVTNCQPLFSR